MCTYSFALYAFQKKISNWSFIIISFTPAPKMILNSKCAESVILQEYYFRNLHFFFVRKRISEVWMPSTYICIQNEGHILLSVKCNAGAENAMSFVLNLKLRQDVCHELNLPTFSFFLFIPF